MASYPILLPAGLSRAPGWPVGAQWARPQAQPRPQRRRNVVQRSAAVAAGVDPRDVHAQPMPARLALRVDALHRPARQVLHGTPTRFPGCSAEKSRLDSEAVPLVCQAKNIQLVVVVLRIVQVAQCRRPIQDDPARSRFTSGAPSGHVQCPRTLASGKIL